MMMEEDPWGDDDASVPEFSAAAVRHEFQSSLPPELPEQEEELESVDGSISTFDIDATSRPPSTHQSPSEEYSTVELSLEDTSHPPESPPHTVDSREATPDEEPHSYPTVVIDVEAELEHRVAQVSQPDSSASSRSGSPPLDLPPLNLSKAGHNVSASTPSAHSSPSLSIAAAVAAAPETPNRPSSANEVSSPTFAQQQQEFQKKMGHRPTKSVGPSTFEKVRSRTRPVHLPPKDRTEDNKHLADWEAMMKLSRQATEKRRAELQKRRLERERRIEESLQRWEHWIVPDWKVVNTTASLRKLWWQGIPSKIRGPMWEKAVGNALALSKDSYRTSLARAKRALNAGTFPAPSLSLMEEDISTTLPSLHLFHPDTGPMYNELRDLLCAWIVSRSDEGLGYTWGAARLAAMFLITMPTPQQAFVVMRNLLERHCLRSFYGGTRCEDDVEAYYRIFDTLLADGMPKSLILQSFVYFNFKQHQIGPSLYLPTWILSLFLDHLPFEACARVWDVVMLEGDSFMYRAALGILAVLEGRLFFPEKQELLALLAGENKAAIEVAKREGVPLDGGKYEIYDLNEENLWDKIDSMSDWWKESTWKRLLTRELPDV